MKQAESVGERGCEEAHVCAAKQAASGADSPRRLEAVHCLLRSPFSMLSSSALLSNLCAPVPALCADKEMGGAGCGGVRESKRRRARSASERRSSTDGARSAAFPLAPTTTPTRRSAATRSRYNNSHYVSFTTPFARIRPPCPLGMTSIGQAEQGQKSRHMHLPSSRLCKTTASSSAPTPIAHLAPEPACWRREQSRCASGRPRPP